MNTIGSQLRRNLVAETQKQEELKNDALYQFFMSMYNISKGLPTKYQRGVRRNLFEAVSDAEDKAEDEITDKCEVDLTYHMNTIIYILNTIVCLMTNLPNIYPKFLCQIILLHGDIRGNVSETLVSRIKYTKFALQMDESTDIAGLAVLLVFVCYVNMNSFEEDLLFCKPLLSNTQGLKFSVYWIIS